MIDPDIMKGFPRISRLECWRHLWRLRYGQWSRRRRGIVRLSGPGSRCLNCRSKDYGYRLGCKGWSPVPCDKGQLEWGWFLDGRTDPEDGCAEFASNSTILEWVKAGRHIQHPDGKRVTLADFEDEGV